MSAWMFCASFLRFLTRNDSQTFPSSSPFLARPTGTLSISTSTLQPVHDPISRTLALPSFSHQKSLQTVTAVAFPTTATSRYHCKQNGHQGGLREDRCYRWCQGPQDQDHLDFQERQEPREVWVSAWSMRGVSLVDEETDGIDCLGELFGWNSLDRPRQQGQGQGSPSQGTRQVAHQALEDHHQEVVSTLFPLTSPRCSLQRLTTPSISRSCKLVPVVRVPRPGTDSR